MPRSFSTATIDYSKGQTIKIIINGIKGYEGRKRKRAAQGRPLRSMAAKSKKSRIKNKLLGKSTWFKKSEVSSIKMYDSVNSKKD